MPAVYWFRGRERANSGKSGVVVGHRTFGLGTGQVIPVLVKAQVVMGEALPSASAPYTTVSSCAYPSTTPTL